MSSSPARRAIGAVLGGAVVVALAACSPQEGWAFEPGGGAGMSVPLKPGSVAVFGAVMLRNRSDHPITLIEARPVRSTQATVAAVRISKVGPGTAIGTMVDEHAPGGRPVPGFVIPPDHHRRRAPGSELWGITIEVTVGRDQREGEVIGIEVVYRDGARVHSQRFPAHLILCAWTGPTCSESL